MIKEMWSSQASRLGGDTRDDTYALAIRGEQVAAFKSTLPFGMLAISINAFVLILFNALTDAPAIHWLWAAIMGSIIIIAAPATWRVYKSQNIVRPRPDSDLKKPLWGAILFGAVWGLGPLLLLAEAGIAQTLLMGTVSAGIMCGGAYIFSAIPRAAAGFVLCVGVCFVAGIGLSDMGSSKWAMMPLVSLYTAVMIRTAYWNHKSLVLAWRQKIELKNQKSELVRQNEVISILLKDFAESASDCLWETDYSGSFLSVSEGLADRFNSSVEGLENKSLIGALVRGGAQRRDVFECIRQALAKSSFANIEVRLHHAGKDKWLSFSGKRKKTGGFRGVVADITEARQAEARINYMAHYDSLTKLANRSQLKNELESALYRQAAKGESFAVLAIDLDRFKVINDVHGHLVGDAVLTTCAQRMNDCIGEANTAARTGGDEFVIIYRAAESSLEALDLANKLLAALGQPMHVEGIVVQVSASVGIAFCPVHGDAPTALLKNADLALYRAKNGGRSRALIFDKVMDDEAGDRRAMEMDLRLAIRDGQFKLFYQPLVNGKTLKATGFEALLRWDHPTKGMIEPEKFVRLAEKTGMITTIGDWVIREALKEASTWLDEQCVSVNLSLLQVKCPTLVTTVVNALATTGVAPERLEFEITETVLFDESEHSLKTLHDLRELGVRISLDDFGTGYSSLSYLRSFPFDKIKIDKSFVQSIQDSSECRAIVSAVAGLAKSLGMRTTAEGVETQEQINEVMTEGCSDLQGYYFSHPLSAQVLEEKGFLRRRKSEAHAISGAPETLNIETKKKTTEILYTEVDPGQRRSAD